MTVSPKPRLVVDPDPEFLAGLAGSGRDTNGFLTTTSGSEAISLIRDGNRSIAAIFVNLGLSTPSGVEVVKEAIRARASIPLFLICDSIPPLSQEDARGMGARGAFSKPISASRLIELSDEHQKERKDRNETEAGSTRATEEEADGGDADFVSIRASDFLSGTTSIFDLFLRLPSGRYLKILNAGDSFSRARLENLLAKGVESFYLRRELHEQYLRYCDKVASILLKKDQSGGGRVPLRFKMSRVMGHGDETLRFIRSRGIDEKGIELARGFVENAREFAKQFPTELADAVRAFLTDVATHDHAVSTAMVATLLARAIEPDNQKLSQIIGLSALLHDFGLHDAGVFAHSKLILAENPALMNDQEKFVFLNHPTAGAALLKGIRGVDPLVLQAIAQHHERIDKSGFPKGLGLGQITEAAEVVGLSEALAREISRAIENPGLNPLIEMERGLDGKFSKRIVEGYLNVFAGKA